MVHVAIVGGEVIDALLAGRKTIESRLATTRRVPFGRVRAGERVYFKARGGPYGCTAIVACVETREGLTPAGVERLRRESNARVCAPASYWRAKRRARYATLVTLRDVQRTEMGPVYAGLPGLSVRSAWLTLADEFDVVPPARRRKSA
jgi:hypothetical protein